MLGNSCNVWYLYASTTPQNTVFFIYIFMYLTLYISKELNFNDSQAFIQAYDVYKLINQIPSY
jgi:hypothetical protein